MKKQNEIIGSWLPCFNGYYGSVYREYGDEQENAEVEYVNEQREEAGKKPSVMWDDLEIDYSGYFKEISEHITEFITDGLKGLGVITDYDSMVLKSPKEYNFQNDSIELNFHLTEENKDRIMQYLKENEEKFSSFIKDNYTSYDGFWSHYSNDYKEWIDREALNDSHKLGKILKFIYENVEKLPVSDDCVMVEYVMERICISEFITNSQELIDNK